MESSERNNKKKEKKDTDRWIVQIEWNEGSITVIKSTNQEGGNRCRGYESSVTSTCPHRESLMADVPSRSSVYQTSVTSYLHSVLHLLNKTKCT